MSAYEISIPYGAIKSCCPSCSAIVPEVISIPYGAIKRETEPRPSNQRHSFQFLMVRLKVLFIVFV